MLAFFLTSLLALPRLLREPCTNSTERRTVKSGGSSYCNEYVFIILLRIPFVKLVTRSTSTKNLFEALYCDLRFQPSRCNSFTPAVFGYINCQLVYYNCFLFGNRYGRRYFRVSQKNSFVGSIG